MNAPKPPLTDADLETLAAALEKLGRIGAGQSVPATAPRNSFDIAADLIKRAVNAKDPEAAKQAYELFEKLRQMCDSALNQD